MTALRTRSLHKTYPSGAVGLRPLDLDVPAGERLAVLGPSGCGKSTLLRLVAGLETPDGGAIELDGADLTRVPPHRRPVAFLPQRPALYPHLTVRDNIAVPLRYSKRPASAIDEPVSLLRLSHLLDRFPHELSGGERQRVALARLAARTASVWLLDEPFAPLDPVFRSEFRHDLHLLAAESVATILLVTHDPVDAVALCHRVGVFAKGRLEQIGPPDELRRRPASRFVASAFGSWSFLPGQTRETRVGGGDRRELRFVAEPPIDVPVPDDIVRRLGDRPAYNLTLGIRPTDVSIRAPDRPLDASPTVELTGWPVVLAEPDGSGWLLTLSRGGSRVRAGWSPGSPPRVGDPVDWIIPLARCVWFDADGQRIVTDDATPQA